MEYRGKQYGAALFALASEAADKEIEKEIAQQLVMISQLLEDYPKYYEILSYPGYRKEHRKEILDQTFCGKIHPWLLNTLQLLCQKNVFSWYYRMAAEYARLYCLAHRKIKVTATTAVPLNDALANRLQHKLEDITKHQITLENTIDPTILGGVRLLVDQKEIDGSFSKEFSRLQHKLSEY